MSKSENIRHEMENHVNHLWLDSEKTPFISQLKNGNNLQSIIDEGKLEQANHFNEIQCSDGRCPHKGNELSVAGSGILLSDKDFEKMLADNPQIDTITTHDQCGAGAIAFKASQENNFLPSGVISAEEYVKYWGQQKAEKYGLKYRHIGTDEFSDSHHHERGIIVDATGKFHPSQVPGMPNMFISQGPAFAGKGYIKDEISILTGIGVGDHAFGHRLNNGSPFYIAVAANDQTQKDHLMKLAEEATKNYGAMVAIEGFISPV